MRKEKETTLESISQKPKYILLEGIENRNRFYCLNTEDDPTIINTGKIVFRILGYAETSDEAQLKLYGRVYK